MPTRKRRGFVDHDDHVFLLAGVEHGLRWIQLADPEGNEFCVGRA